MQIVEKLNCLIRRQVQNHPHIHKRSQLILCLEKMRWLQFYIPFITPPHTHTLARAYHNMYNNTWLPEDSMLELVLFFTNWDLGVNIRSQGLTASARASQPPCLFSIEVLKGQMYANYFCKLYWDGICLIQCLKLMSIYVELLVSC